MKWLITGGCGFIGTALIKDLQAEGGHTIRVIDNLSVGQREDLAKVSNYREITRKELSNLKVPSSDHCQLIIGDIIDEDLALSISKDMDVIVHLAANTGVAPSVENPRQDCITNVIGTLNYLEASRRNNVRRFIFASSGAPVGEVQPPIHEELPAHPVSPYGASKLAGEGYCSAYYRTFGVGTVALRFGNVYGPGSQHKNSVIAKFIQCAINGESIEIFGDGNQTRDFIYIDDLVGAIKLAANKENVSGHVFQIATNSETTINNLIDILLNVIRNQYDLDVKCKYAKPRLGDVKRNYSNTEKAKAILGWQPKIILKDGLVRTIESYMHNAR